MKRFICVQTGARRNYAVPTILNREKLLEAFYSDLNASAGIGKLLDKVTPSTFRRRSLSRLLSRKVPSDLIDKTYTFDLPAIKFILSQKLARGDIARSNYLAHRFDEEFSQAMIHAGLGNATHIFSMFGEGSRFIEFAKKNGLKIVVEEYLSPLTHEIVQAEREKYPEMETPLPQEVIERDYSWFKRLCSSVDIFLAPSNFVIQGLESSGVSPDCCYLVPYAVSDEWFDVKNKPIKGRILFVGTAELRKGIHILGMAAEKLVPYEYEFRVAGHASEVVRKHPSTKHLTFLGRVPRNEIHKEFAQADVFVLPSLAEGSAEVTYEAMAVGLPIITTNAAGSMIVNSKEGFIIPERNCEALTERLVEIVENRDIRNSMSIASKNTAKNYTWEKYANLLLSVFQDL